MQKLITLLITLGLLSTALTAFSGPRTHIPSETALYAITFTSTWSAGTHPAPDFPANAHYSRMHGGTHKADVRFWQAGELASAGMESMAETGGYALLEGEVEAAIAAGTADQFLLGGNLASSIGNIRFDPVTVDRNFPLLTLVTMVAPSPDWFVGVDSLSLLDENGEWRNSIVLSLYPYDAGTDDGTTYGAPNADTNPKQPVANISGEAPFSSAPMGFLELLRLDAPTVTPIQGTPTQGTPLPQTPTAIATTPVGPTATPTVSPTPTAFCPAATAQPFQVDYVSPTNLLTQTLAIRIGDSDAVTITAPSGVYTATGNFEFAAPALVTIGLQPDQANEMRAVGHVRKAISVGPCQYGDYTLSETLTIVQGAGYRSFMPVIR